MVKIGCVVFEGAEGNMQERPVLRLWWSGGSMLLLSTQVRGFKPGRSRQDFSGRKIPQHALLQKGSKAVGPMLQICGT